MNSLERAKSAIGILQECVRRIETVRKSVPNAKDILGQLRDEVESVMDQWVELHYDGALEGEADENGEGIGPPEEELRQFIRRNFEGVAPAEILEEVWHNLYFDSCEWPNGVRETASLRTDA